MRSLAITGVVLATLMAPSIAFAQHESGVGAPPVVTMAAAAAMKAPPMLPPAAAHAQSGTRALPGPMTPGIYQQPYYGYTLPQYWVAPSYFIANYGAYGLAVPAQGFGWSRYYDDAVLTDRWGRVYDWRGNVAWDREGRSNEDYGDSYGYRDDRVARGNNGLAGAAVGALVGGVAGNVIAGRGNRLAGTLIGGGVGAVAGMAIDRSGAKRQRGYARDARIGDYSYDGRWTGSWNGGPTQTYQGRFDGNVRPHWQAYPSYQGYQPGPHLDYGAGYGYSASGPAVVTVIVQPGAPVVTRTVSYQTEYVRVAARKHVATRAWRPKPKPAARCICGS